MSRRTRPPSAIARVVRRSNSDPTTVDLIKELRSIDWNRVGTRVLNAFVIFTVAYHWWAWDTPTEESMRDLAVTAFRTGYKTAKPEADSVEVRFHAEWYRDAIHPDSTAYYVKPETVVYDTIPEQTTVGE